MTDFKSPMRDRLADVIEATKLTRSGHLQEATALLRRSFENSDGHPSPELSSPQLTAGSMPKRARGIIEALARTLSPVLKGLGASTPNSSPASDVTGAGSFVERAFANEAGARDYKLYIPASFCPHRPLVVMLHGCGQSPDDFAAGTRMNALADAHGFLVAYPAQSGRAHVQRCWNWYQPGDQGRDTGEAGIIAGITRAVMKDHVVDSSRVYIAGLSAGAAAAANIARAYPELYAAVGIHSGLPAGCANDVTSALTAMRLGPLAANSCDLTPAALRLPTIVVHGESDSTVHPSNGEQVLTQAGADFLDSSADSGMSSGGLSYTRTRYSDAEGRVRIESWLVRGLGHSWSGGDLSGSHTDPRGPDASEAMVDFFLARSLAS